MKTLLENWRGFVNEQDGGDVLELWQQVLYQAAEEQGLSFGGSSLSESDDDLEDDAPEGDALEDDDSEEESSSKRDPDAPDGFRKAQKIELPARGTPASPYCIHTPLISEWALSSPDRLAETIIFVFASMQTPWNLLIPYFRSVMYMVRHSSEVGDIALPERYVFTPKRSLEASDQKYIPYLVTMDKIQKGVLTIDANGDFKEDRKHPKFYAFSKTKYEDDPKYARAINKIIKHLRNANSKKLHDRANKEYKILKDIHDGQRKEMFTAAFKSQEKIDNLTPEQERYISAGFGNLAQIMSTPGIGAYMPIWEDRQKYFDMIQPLAKDVVNNPDNTESLLKLFATILQNVRGLALAKTGFLVQLLTGKLGCVDSIWTKVLGGSDPELAAFVKKTSGRGVRKHVGKNPNTLPNRMRRRAQGYIDLLKAFQEKGVDSEDMWNAWVKQVSMQIKSPGKYKHGEVLYQLMRDGEEILSGPVGYTYSKGSLYKKQHNAFVDALNGLAVSDETANELGFINDAFVSYHHLPGRIDIPASVSGRGLSSSLTERKMIEAVVLKFCSNSGIQPAVLRDVLKEELSREDKSEIKKMIQDEFEKLMKKKDTKDKMAELTKKVMKKLYRDLSLQHPYIIDRIKV